ncbi:hypothetical protein [Lyngbya confervoides]|uniref:Uncharacterized protein n=1 Tax=Lyngbya confervoides BDU141951 TaxID=1574623 RepID=A0ABD4T9A1_9CYAN|nr:hypothetical protein [Lyngbya confervoides]MCM1985094.1 hypothetical protein [Lyngbya confervoides BDU141951]
MNKLRFKYFVMGLGLVLAIALSITVGSVWPKSQPQAVEGELPSLLAVSQGNFPVNQLSPDLPETLKPCLPEQFARAELLAELEQNDQHLYHVQVTYGDDVAQPLIAVQGDRCQVLNPRDENNADVPLSTVIDEEVAKTLALQRYQRTFEQVGGKDEFQKLLNEEAENAEATVWIPQENYDALQTLGISMPDNVQPTQEVPGGQP